MEHTDSDQRGRGKCDNGRKKGKRLDKEHV